MSSRANQKRAATSGVRSSSDVGRAFKKTRFEEPTEDPVAFSEEVDSALEDPSSKRKGRVKTDGYESDSTDDGEGVVLSRRNDDGDMFAVGEEQLKEEEQTGKKKKQEFLRLGDIEGQEFGTRSGSESSDEGEPEDEDDAERKKKAGMGYELSSFNMREEMEEGKFAADGTYVRSFDPHGVHDRWMDGIDEKDIKMARRRKKAHDRQQKERMEAEALESQQKEELEKSLLAMLKKGESVLEALQRFGTRSKKLKKAAQSGSNVDDAESAKATSDIDQITHLASNLMSFGDVDIYSKTFEELVRSVRSSGKVDPSWIPVSADVKYEYKWDIPGRSSEVFGPFSEEEVRSWFKATYFGVAGEMVKIRLVGGNWGDWADVMT